MFNKVGTGFKVTVQPKTVLHEENQVALYEIHSVGKKELNPHASSQVPKAENVVKVAHSAA